MFVVRVEIYADGNPYHTLMEVFQHFHHAEEYASCFHGLWEGPFGLAGEDATIQSLTLDGCGTNLGHPDWVWNYL